MFAYRWIAGDSGFVIEQQAWNDIHKVFHRIDSMHKPNLIEWRTQTTLNKPRDGGHFAPGMGTSLSIAEKTFHAQCVSFMEERV